MILTGLQFNDRIEVPTARQITDSGQMIVPCAFARTGEMVYSAGSLNLKGVAPETPITVCRDEADVFEEASLLSFRSVPVTVGHPRDEAGKLVNVTAQNSDKYQVGVLEGMPTRNEDTLTGTLVITRQDAIDVIEDGTKELSAGYTCDIEMVVDEQGVERFYQRRIRANHIAIVPKGRAGSMCAIADELVEDESPDGGDGLGKHDNVPDESFDPNALAAGIAVELEHTDSQEKAESIAKDHLSEDPDYYVKLAKMEDASEEKTDAVLLADALVSVSTLTDELAASQALVATLRDEMHNSVKEMVHVVLVARDITDMVDFKDMTVQDIKRSVLSKLVPTADFSDKTDAYVDARFDMAAEDADMQDTPMGRLLRDQASASHLEVKPKPSTLVTDARKRFIDRQTKAR